MNVYIKINKPTILYCFVFYMTYLEYMNQVVNQTKNVLNILYYE